MAIKFSNSGEIRPRGESVKMKPETIRDLADQVAAKEKNAKTGEKKKPMTIRVAPKVLTYFQATGLGWQTRLNKVLEDWVEQQIRG